MQHFINNVADQFGNGIKRASVMVQTSGGVNASIYSDNGVTLKANPITTDSNGVFDFYAANGNYVLSITAPNGSVTTSAVTLFDPDSLSASSGAGIVGTTHGTLSAALDTLFTAADTGTSTITFAADGSIVETRSGLVITTAFSGNTITETYSGSLSKVVTTTFNADGSISRTEA